MSFDVNWDIDKHREDHESDEQWILRRNFMERWKKDYPEERLVCLARVFANMEFMGCRYPQEVMQEVERMSKEVNKNITCKNNLAIYHAGHAQDNQEPAILGQENMQRPEYSYSTNPYQSTVKEYIWGPYSREIMQGTASISKVLSTTHSKNFIRENSQNQSIPVVNNPLNSFPRSNSNLPQESLSYYTESSSNKSDQNAGNSHIRWCRESINTYWGSWEPHKETETQQDGVQSMKWQKNQNLSHEYNQPNPAVGNAQNSTKYVDIPQKNTMQSGDFQTNQNSPYSEYKQPNPAVGNDQTFAKDVDATHQNQMQSGKFQTNQNSPYSEYNQANPTVGTAQTSAKDVDTKQQNTIQSGNQVYPDIDKTQISDKDVYTKLSRFIQTSQDQTCTESYGNSNLQQNLSRHSSETASNSVPTLNNETPNIQLLEGYGASVGVTKYSNTANHFVSSYQVNASTSDVANYSGQTNTDKGPLPNECDVLLKASTDEAVNQASSSQDNISVNMPRETMKECDLIGKDRRNYKFWIFAGKTEEEARYLCRQPLNKIPDYKIVKEYCRKARRYHNSLPRHFIIKGMFQKKPFHKSQQMLDNMDRITEATVNAGATTSNVATSDEDLKRWKKELAIVEPLSRLAKKRKKFWLLVGKSEEEATALGRIKYSKVPGYKELKKSIGSSTYINKLIKSNATLKNVPTLATVNANQSKTNPIINEISDSVDKKLYNKPSHEQYEVIVSVTVASDIGPFASNISTTANNNSKNTIIGFSTAAKDNDISHIKQIDDCISLSANDAKVPSLPLIDNSLVKQLKAKSKKSMLKLENKEHFKQLLTKTLVEYNADASLSIVISDDEEDKTISNAELNLKEKNTVNANNDNVKNAKSETMKANNANHLKIYIKDAKKNINFAQHRALQDAIHQCISDNNEVNIVTVDKFHDCVIVTCADGHSRDWLDKQIPSLVPWEGAELVIVDEHDVFVPLYGYMYVPTDPEIGTNLKPQDLLEKLLILNPKAGCDKWKVLNSQDQGEGLLLMVRIDGKYEKVLQSMGFRLDWYSPRPVRIKLKGKGKRSTKEKALPPKKAVNKTKNKKFGNNPKRKKLANNPPKSTKLMKNPLSRNTILSNSLTTTSNNDISRTLNVNVAASGIMLQTEYLKASTSTHRTAESKQAAFAMNQVPSMYYGYPGQVIPAPLLVKEQAPKTGSSMLQPDYLKASTSTHCTTQNKQTALAMDQAPSMCYGYPGQVIFAPSPVNEHTPKVSGSILQAEYLKAAMSAHCTTQPKAASVMDRVKQVTSQFELKIKNKSAKLKTGSPENQSDFRHTNRLQRSPVDHSRKGNAVSYGIDAPRLLQGHRAAFALKTYIREEKTDTPEPDYARNDAEFRCSYNFEKVKAFAGEEKYSLEEKVFAARSHPREYRAFDEEDLHEQNREFSSRDQEYSQDRDSTRRGQAYSLGRGEFDERNRKTHQARDSNELYSRGAFDEEDLHEQNRDFSSRDQEYSQDRDSTRRGEAYSLGRGEFDERNRKTHQASDSNELYSRGAFDEEDLHEQNRDFSSRDQEYSQDRDSTRRGQAYSLGRGEFDERNRKTHQARDSNELYSRGVFDEQYLHSEQNRVFSERGQEYSQDRVSPGRNQSYSLGHREFVDRNRETRQTRDANEIYTRENRDFDEWHQEYSLETLNYEKDHEGFEDSVDFDERYQEFIQKHRNIDESPQYSQESMNFTSRDKSRSQDRTSGRVEHNSRKSVFERDRKYRDDSYKTRSESNLYEGPSKKNRFGTSQETNTHFGRSGRTPAQYYQNPKSDKKLDQGIVKTTKKRKSGAQRRKKKLL